MNKCVVLYIYFFNKSRFLCAFKNIKTIYISGILSLISFVLNPTPDRSCDSHVTWLLRHLFFGPCHWVRQSLKLNPSSGSIRLKVAEPLLWGCLEAGAQSLQRAKISLVQSIRCLPKTRATHTNPGSCSWTGRSPLPDLGKKKRLNTFKEN